MPINKNNEVSITALFPWDISYFRSLLLLVILILFGGTPLLAQTRVTATRDLEFGSFAAGSTGGNVIVSPQGSLAVTGSIIAMPDPFPHAAVIEVRVNGKNRSNIMFELPPEAALSLPGGGAPMVVSNFSSDVTSPIIDQGDNKPRTYIINIGATLNVQSGNTAGEYSGEFPVTFTFIQE